MKKLIAVSLCLTMLLLTAACGSPNQAPPSSSDGDVPPSTGDTLTPGSTDEPENGGDALPPEDGDTDEDGSGEPDNGSTVKPEPKPDASKPNTSKPDASKPNTSKPNTSKPDTSKPDTSKPDTSKPDTSSSKGYSGTLPELVEAIYANQPMEISLADPIAVDLTDSYSGQYFLGLSDTSKVKEAYYSEPMIGSQAYSLVVVRVKDAADATDVAKSMYNGVDQAKWICVYADAVAAGVYGDTIMLVMVSSGLSPTLHTDLRAAFSTACGGTLDTSMDRLDAEPMPEDGLAPLA